jgi:hypothetical protein
VSNAEWQREKQEKQAERQAKQFMRRMAGPIARGEVAQFGEAQAMHIASLALAIEALEQLLVKRDVLKADELMDLMKSLASQKQEQALAAQAASQQSNLIAEA